MMDQEKGTIGSSFEDFLHEEGIAGEVSEIATKKVLAALLVEQMKLQNISQSAMAKRMNTSRAQVQRLLNPENDSVTLNTMRRAAKLLGKQVRIDLV